MPAHRSSCLPAALTQLARADPYPLHPAEAPHLLVYLATIPDPRAVRGRRHPLVAILAMAAAAVLTGARSMTAIGVLSQAGPVNLAAALRHHGRDPRRPWPPSDETGQYKNTGALR